MDDPVSCLLCLDVFERSTMLRVPLVPIGGDGPNLYCLCQRCGGAIAAEYLYIQNSGKSESIGGLVNSTDPKSEATSNVEISSRGVDGESASSGSPAPAPGETETVAETSESAASPRRSKKEGRKESV